MNGAGLQHFCDIQATGGQLGHQGGWAAFGEGTQRALLWFQISSLGTVTPAESRRQVPAEAGVLWSSLVRTAVQRPLPRAASYNHSSCPPRGCRGVDPGLARELHLPHPGGLDVCDQANI